jgi:hypothetical protein
MPGATSLKRISNNQRLVACDGPGDLSFELFSCLGVERCKCTCLLNIGCLMCLHSDVSSLVPVDPIMTLETGVYFVIAVMLSI